MIWLGLALVAALSESLKNLFSKQGLSHVPPHIAALAASASAFPILIGFFFLHYQVPHIGEQFWIALLAGGALNILAIIQFMRAIQVSDLSLTIPFITFTPLFLLVTSPILVGEFPSALAVFGILFIVIGAYTLQIQEVHRGYFAPFSAILNEKGPRRMLSVAFIYSLTSNFDKIGVLNSSPMFWSVSINAFMAGGLFAIFLLHRPRTPTHDKRPALHIFIFIGLFHAITLISQNIALDLATVSSVISVKRASALFAVVWGYFVLQETNLKERFSGALLMILGIGLIWMGEGE